MVFDGRSGNFFYWLIVIFLFYERRLLVGFVIFVLFELRVVDLSDELRGHFRYFFFTSVPFGRVYRYLFVYGSTYWVFSMFFFASVFDCLLVGCLFERDYWDIIWRFLGVIVIGYFGTRNVGSFRSVYCRLGGSI